MRLSEPGRPNRGIPGSQGRSTLRPQLRSAGFTDIDSSEKLFNDPGILAWMLPRTVSHTAHIPTRLFENFYVFLFRHLHKKPAILQLH